MSFKYKVAAFGWMWKVWGKRHLTCLTRKAATGQPSQRRQKASSPGWPTRSDNGRSYSLLWASHCLAAAGCRSNDLNHPCRYWSGTPRKGIPLLLFSLCVCAYCWRLERETLMMIPSDGADVADDADESDDVTDLLFDVL